VPDPANWPELPDIGANDPQADVKKALFQGKLDVCKLERQNEIDAAKLVHFDYLNAQDQQQLVWPASFVVARAYVDQLARSRGLPTPRINAIRDALTGAERASGQARRDALSQLATRLSTDAQASTDQPKVRMLIAVVNDLGK